MVTAAGLLAVASAAGGELGRIQPERISAVSAGAVVYLAVVGSLVGYLCYVWLDADAPSTLLATYPHGDPARAGVLGWVPLWAGIRAPALLAGAASLAA